jgi:hypothetical protein
MEATPSILGSYSGGYEESYLLGYNAVWSVESQSTFWRNMSPPSSWYLLRAGFLLGLFFHPED